MTRARPLVYRTIPRSVFFVGFVASFVSIRLGLTVPWFALLIVALAACVFGEEKPTRIVGRGTRFLPNWNKRAVDGYLADVREVAPAQFRDRFLTVASQQTIGSTPAAVLLGRSASQWWPDDPRAHQRSTGKTG